MTNAEIKFLELVPSQLKEIAKQLAKLNENMDKLISQNQAAPNLVKPSDKVVPSATTNARNGMTAKRPSSSSVTR